jgi:hypothetical protein
MKQSNPMLNSLQQNLDCFVLLKAHGELAMTFPELCKLPQKDVVPFSSHWSISLLLFIE